MHKDCDLCRDIGGILLWENASFRIVRVDEPDYPGYCRVIWNAHVREMSDLPQTDQTLLLQVLMAVEGVIRAVCAPDKINLASLGNMTPHLHWHIIPRWQDDRHFPQPIWGIAQRDHAGPRRAVSDALLNSALSAALLPFERTT